MSNYMDCGIYKIENTVTGDMYIGQSIKLSTRERQHFSALGKERHGNKFLQRSFDKYGRDSFVYKVLMFCEKFELTRYEQALVDIYDPVYNICKECVTSSMGIIRGKMRDEHKRKIALAGIGRKVTEQTRRKISATLMGHPVSDKVREILSNANLGKPSPTKGKKSKYSAWNKGLKLPKHSEEQNQKTSQSLMGHASWSKGKKWTDEQKKNLCGRTVWNKGIKTGNLPEETKRKMAISQKVRREREATNETIRNNC